MSISPDGLWLVFEGMDGGEPRYLFHDNGRQQRTRLTNDPKIDFDPVRRPLLNQ